MHIRIVQKNAKSGFIFFFMGQGAILGPTSFFKRNKYQINVIIIVFVIQWKKNTALSIVFGLFFSFQFNPTIKKVAIKHHKTFISSLAIASHFLWYYLNWVFLVYIFLWFPIKGLSVNTLAYMACRISFSMHCIQNSNFWLCLLCSLFFLFTVQSEYSKDDN